MAPQPAAVCVTDRFLHRLQAKTRSCRVESCAGGRDSSPQPAADSSRDEYKNVSSLIVAYAHYSTEAHPPRAQPAAEQSERSRLRPFFVITQFSNTRTFSIHLKHPLLCVIQESRRLGYMYVFVCVHSGAVLVIAPQYELVECKIDARPGSTCKVAV